MQNPYGSPKRDLRFIADCNSGIGFDADNHSYEPRTLSRVLTLSRAPLVQWSTIDGSRTTSSGRVSHAGRTRPSIRSRAVVSTSTSRQQGGVNPLERLRDHERSAEYRDRVARRDAREQGLAVFWLFPPSA